MTKPNYQKEFRDQGYTVARGFFHQAEMDALISAIKAPDKDGRASGLNKGELMFYNNNFARTQKVRDLLASPHVVEFLRQVIGPDFWVRWDQAVYKGPGAGSFPWHQDNAYNKLKDEHFQLWVALSKINNERGGLWLLPGSHKNGTLPHKQSGNHLAFTGPTEGAVCVEAEVGDLVLFSSLMLHYTSPNVSKFDRWAYVAEIMSLDHFDPFVKPPYFVLARDGKPNPEFVHFYRGRLRLGNQMKYVVPRLQRGAGSVRTLASKGIRSILPRKEK